MLDRVTTKSTGIRIVAHFKNASAHISGVPAQKRFDIVPINQRQTAIEAKYRADRRRSPQVAKIDLTHRVFMQAESALSTSNLVP
jgi:hypothetical protein